MPVSPLANYLGAKAAVGSGARREGSDIASLSAMIAMATQNRGNYVDIDRGPDRIRYTPIYTNIFHWIE